MSLAWRRISHGTATGLVIVGVVLVCLRAALPFFVEHYVNRVLNQIPGYHGSIGGVDMEIWRGAYEIQDAKLEKLNSRSIPIPFFQARTVDLMLEWRELLHGALVGQITLYEPKLNFVAGPTDEASQTGIDQSWQTQVEALFPLRLNRLLIFNGEVHFRNFYSQPNVNIFLDHLQVEATNLKNTREAGENLFATVDVTGQPMKGASLRLHARLDALARDPTFDLNGELHDMPLADLNNFFMAYGGFQMSGGQLDVFTELAASDGNITGYVKPILKQSSVEVWSGRETNPAQFLWEPLVALVSQFIKNWPHEQFATKIPVSGRFDDPNLHSWTAFFNLIKNAWIRAVPPGVDNSVKIQDVKADNATPAPPQAPAAFTRSTPGRAE